MATAGSLIYNTKLDTSGMEKGLKGMTGKVSSTGSTIKSILGGLGIATLVSKGIGAINNSLDGAIKRLDTMNNFPKVMSNLGIDAEKSQKAIDKLSDGLQNVPTTLDEAALAVQRFASVNNDVDKSADIFLAVNDAILAGGASAQVQSSALEQLSQAYSKGRPDMMEWRTIQMAMPAQLKQVALAMGYAGGNTAQLGEDLRTGKVSMDEFVNTIMNLDKEGANGFQSFADQAKNSVGGVQTSITNMKTAITRGVAGAIGQLDQSLKDSGLGGLSGVITKIGKAVESLIKKVTPIIPPIINALVNIYNWMKKHEVLVKTLAVIIGAFIGTFMLIQKVIAIINAVKTAFALLNVVMMANPIGLIIAGIVALVAGFVLLWKKSEAFRNFWIGLWEGIKSIVIGAWNGIKAIFTGVINFVKNNWKSILLFLINPFAGAFSYLYNHSTKFRNFINGIVNSVVNFIKSIPSKIASVPKKMLSIGKDIVKGIWNGINSAKDWIIDKIKSFASLLPKAIKKILKIGSPSKVFADEVGKWIPAGVAVGIDANTDSALKSINDMSNEMIRKMQNAVSLETGKLSANANIKGNSFLNATTVNSHIATDVYLDRTKVGQAITPVVSQTLKKAGVR